MLTIYAQLAGMAAFLVVTVILGVAIRRNPTKEGAQRLSRISHAFFWLSLVPL